MKTYRDLEAWKQAIDLVVNVYEFTESFPADERYGLVSQMRRAALSVPANIAEGQGRMSVGEWRQFLGHARGSLYELESHIEVATRLGVVDGSAVGSLLRSTEAVGKTLSGLIRWVASHR